MNKIIHITQTNISLRNWRLMLFNKAIAKDTGKSGKKEKNIKPSKRNKRKIETNQKRHSKANLYKS